MDLPSPRAAPVMKMLLAGKIRLVAHVDYSVFSFQAVPSAHDVPGAGIGKVAADHERAGVA